MNQKPVIFLALLCSCSFPSEGIPRDESSSSSDEGGTSFVGSGPSSGSGTSHGSQSGTTAISTTGASTETSGTESTSESGSSEEASSGSGSTESSSGESVTTDYGPCSMMADPACESPADTCIWTDGVADVIGPAGWCARACTDGNEATDCPGSTDGVSTATPSCTYYGALPLKCMLRCDEGKTCPDGMMCILDMHTPEYGNEYVFVCAWPAR